MIQQSKSQAKQHCTQAPESLDFNTPWQMSDPEGLDLIPDLETSGSCRMSRRILSVLMKRAQQGKQNSSRMRMPRCRMVPTCFRFLLPYVWVRREDQGGHHKEPKGLGKRSGQQQDN